MNKYINLITHSHYSLLQSSLSLEQIVNFAVENNNEYASLIDVNVMYGANEFYNLCKTKNIKPIIGLQVNFSNSNLALIAKNYSGYQLLLKISSCIMTEQNYELEQFLNNDLVLIRIDGDFTWNSPNFYVTNSGDKSNNIACKEVFYLDKNNYQVFKIIDAIKNEKVIKINLNEETKLEHKLLTSSEFKKEFNSIQLQNLVKVLDQIDLVFPNKYDNNIIKFKNDLGVDSKEFLSLLTNEKLNKYLNANPNLNKEQYFKRLNFELDIIKNKNFEDYFLLVYDFVNWSKNNNIMIGPGRGSAAGSLVSFCLNITEIDPIKYNLLFERFLNIERISMPDIDIDVMDTKRDNLINYLFDKYGQNHVCHIVTFSRMKAKQAIRDVGKVLEINSNTINLISKNIKADFETNLIDAILNPTKYSSKVKKNLDVLKEEFIANKDLFYYSQQLIGLPRQTGTHAAGIILSEHNLTDYVAIQSTLNNKIMCQTSMEYLEQMNLIKFDILGLRNLTIIDNIIKLVNHTHKTKIDLKSINLNDQGVFTLFQNANTNGIFQFESDGMKKTLKAVKPHCLEDLSIVSAIYRPGAYESINLYLKNRNSNNQTYLNEQIKEVLEPTYGTIIYQEQIIKLVEIIANFDKFKADNFRKAISKKKEELILQSKNEFMEGAKKNNYSEQEANKQFENMLKFANYGFNHSHSLAYSLISYWLAYLKYYYPIESISVFLTYGESNSEKLASYLKEVKNFNINIVNPDINLSSTSFVLLESKIIFSFLAIANLGLESAKKIIEIRNNEPNKQFNDALVTIAKLSMNGVNKTSLTNLIKVGAFDSLNSNRTYLLTNLDILVDKKLNTLNNENKFLFTLPLNNDVYDDKNVYADWEKEVLGVSFSKSKYELLFEKYKKTYHLVNIDELEEQIEFNVLFKLKTSFKKNAKNKKEYLLLEIVNNDIQYSLTVFDNIEKYEEELKFEEYYIANLRLSNDRKNMNLSTILKKVEENEQ